VTAVSRLEDFEFSRRKLRARALPLCVYPAGFFFLSATSWLNGLNSALLAALLAQALLASARSQGGSPTNRPGEPPPNRPGEPPTNRPGEPPFNHPGGQLHGAALFVRKALPGLFLVDAGIVLALSPRGVDPWPAFLTLYALFAVAWTWKRSWIRAGAMGS
jgi:hypothetical protein